MTDLAPLIPLAASLISDCIRHGYRIVTAESCTGGLVSAALTEIPGSSAVVDRGFVSYSNAAKIEALGVPESLIDSEGAVSEAVARAMAEGALAHSPADLAVAVTGIAGPGGGTREKPVGLVCFAGIRRGGPPVLRTVRFADTGRSGVRLAAAREALALLRSLL
jgi:nicotinamide-nucleotide amidase